MSANASHSLAALSVLLAATDQQVGPIAPIPALPTSPHREHWSLVKPLSSCQSKLFSISSNIFV